jgi:hypothetical protein
LLKHSPVLHGYYVFDAGGLADLPLFDSEETALMANEKAPAWIRGSLIDVIDREPEVRAPES